jgi:hypothetical protein
MVWTMIVFDLRNIFCPELAFTIKKLCRTHDKFVIHTNTLNAMDVYASAIANTFKVTKNEKENAAHSFYTMVRDS